MFPPPLHRICRVSIRPTDIGRDGGRRRMVMETASIYPFNVSHLPPPLPFGESARLFLYPSLCNDVSGMVRSFVLPISVHAYRSQDRVAQLRSHSAQMRLSCLDNNRAPIFVLSRCIIRSLPSKYKPRLTIASLDNSENNTHQR